MRKQVSFILLFFIFVWLPIAYSQAAKDFYTEGINYLERKDYDNAITEFSKALIVKPTYYDAKYKRAECYFQKKNYQLALDEIEALVDIKPKEEYLLLQANAYLVLQKYQRAKDIAEYYLENVNAKSEYYKVIISSCFHLFQYDSVVFYTKKKKNETYYDANDLLTNSISLDKLKKYNEAIIEYQYTLSNAKQGLEPNRKQLITLSNYGIARCFYYVNNLNNSLEFIDKCLIDSIGFSDAHYLKGCVFNKRIDFINAQKQFEEAYKFHYKDSLELLNKLFDLSLELKQDSSAIFWLNKLINYSNTNNDSLRILRGRLHLKIKNYLNAYSDFSNIINSKTSDNIVELKRLAKIDNDKPTIIVTSAPNLKNGVIIPSNNDKLVKLDISILDNSFIKSIHVQNKDAEFDKKMLNPSAYAEVAIDNELKNILIEVIDVFDNIETKNIVVQLDTVPPEVIITFPNKLENNEFVPEFPDDKRAYIEFSIIDNDSYLSDYTIDNNKTIIDKKASKIDIQKTFDIEGKDTLQFEANDENGNKSKLTLSINRKKAQQNLQNPMGKTWFVIIENGDYKNFSQLEGPKRDVSYLKSAIVKYDFDSVLHLRNLSLAEMRIFFERDLNKLLSKYQVKSVVVWYAGHGKYSNNDLRGYWVPVDATANDFDTFFSLTELKIYLANYKRIKHLLLISDACETGQSFYAQKPIKNSSSNCSDMLNHFQSSECFTSSDKEGSADNSAFAKSFSNVLQRNTESCISISKVAELVTQIVESNNKQKPIFGRITGMEDEKGTFLFRRK